jgi:hypothetical protein
VLLSNGARLQNLQSGGAITATPAHAGSSGWLEKK